MFLGFLDVLRYYLVKWIRRIFFWVGLRRWEGCKFGFEVDS